MVVTSRFFPQIMADIDETGDHQLLYDVDRQDYFASEFEEVSST